MNCCDDYGNCTQGRDCPAQAKPIRRTDPGIERDCDLELAAIEAEDYRKGGEWVFLRAAIDIALNPINREGSLL